MPKSRAWGAKGTCLLVADGSTRESLQAALTRVGLTIKGAASEAGAIAALEREPLVAAVVSHAVGPSAISSIVTCARQRHPEVPVVVLGSTSTVEEAVDVMRRGAADYVPTPLEVQVLLLRLQRIV